MTSEDVIEINLKKALIDIILFNVALWLNLFHESFLTPTKRGLFCDDLTIRYPLRGSTVTFRYLILIGFCSNAISICLCEFLRRQPGKYVILYGNKFPHWLYRVYTNYGLFCFGDLLLWGVTDLIKYTVGRLRPHFYQACLPKVCLDRYTPTEFYEDVQCINKEYPELRLSFPSGHSSFFMYSMLFCAIYLHKRLTWNGSTILKYILEYTLITSGIVVGMTRVADYKHHYSDVFVGLFLGGSFACIVAYCITDLFETPVKDKETSSVNK